MKEKSAHDIIDFWFVKTDPKFWFEKNEKFDRKLRDEFESTYDRVVAGKTAGWRSTSEGKLAEIIVLDQFARNMFRDTPKAFAADSLALELAQDAVLSGADKDLPIIKRGFMYMPYMHSEDAQIHKEALRLFNQEGLEDNLKYEKMHKDIIDRFGRYPHRNKILGRESTPEEIKFLKQPGSSF